MTSAAPAECPPSEALEAAALADVLPGDIAAHVGNCPACRRILRQIREDNAFLSRFAENGALPSAPQPRDDFTLQITGYELVGEIHRGGQGVVYRARQCSTRRDVAIKVMKEGPFATLTDRARFEREIETLAKLEHPNIAAVHDAGVVSGFHYFVMNYVEGKPLDEALAPIDGADRIAKVLDVFIKTCDAVHAAHLRGVIHRDLKPSNIRVAPSGEPYVLDFGLAKSADGPADAAMTQTGQFVGSLPWAAPEQVEGLPSKIDLRTDVYSLGAILFQLLTGAPPFDVGSNLRDALDEILRADPPRPSARLAAAGKPGVDDELDTIVLKCLSKDRERRYQSAGELARDLRRYLADEPIEAKRDSAWYVLRKTAWQKRRVLAALLAPLLLLVIAAFAVNRSIATAKQAAKERSLREVEAGRNAAMLEITRRLQARPGSAADSPGGRLNQLNVDAIRTDLDTGSLSVSDYGVATLLAETLRDQGTPQAIVEAEGLVRQAMYMLGREHGPNHPEMGRLRTLLAEMLLRRGNRMPEAEQTAELGVEELRSAFGEASPEAARGLIMLARIRLARGNADGAMDAAKQALAAKDAGSLLVDALKSEPPHPGRRFADLGTLFRDEAQIILAAVQAAQGHELDASQMYITGLRSMLWSAHDTDSRLLDALELGASLADRKILTSLELFEPGSLHPPLDGMSLPALLRDVAGTLRGGADGSERDAHYLPARYALIGLRERLCGSNDFTLGASLAAVASLVFDAELRQERYDAAMCGEAEALFRRAIPLQIEAEGVDSPLVGRSYETLATCLRDGMRLREATKYYVLDCELWMRQPQELRDPYQVMLRARWAAWHATRAGDFELGLKWTDRALADVARTLGAEHGAAALMHACRALCLVGLSRTADAAGAEAIANRILAAQPVPDDQRSECLRLLGLVCLRAGDLEEAGKQLAAGWKIRQAQTINAHGYLEWARTMAQYARATGDDAAYQQFADYLRQEGRGDVTIEALNAN